MSTPSLPIRPGSPPPAARPSPSCRLRSRSELGAHAAQLGFPAHAAGTGAECLDLGPPHTALAPLRPSFRTFQLAAQAGNPGFIAYPPNC